MRIPGKDIKITTDDIVVCYDDLGSGNIPLIFIHGFPLNKSTWQSQLHSLQEQYRVIAYDLRGFGDTTRGKEKISIGLFADDLINFMDALQIKKAIVCGLSMGGYILLNAIHRYPERFEGLILCDTQCIADVPSVKEKRKKTIAKITSTGLNDFADEQVKALFCKESLEQKTIQVEEIKKLILATSEQSIINALHAMAERQEMCTWLYKISIPTLIICGKQDTLIPVEQSTFLRNKISGSFLRTIEGAGHLSNLEQPSKFNDLLSSFLSGLEKTPSKELIKV